MFEQRLTQATGDQFSCVSVWSEYAAVQTWPRVLVHTDFMNYQVFYIFGLSVCSSLNQLIFNSTSTSISAHFQTDANRYLDLILPWNLWFIGSLGYYTIYLGRLEISEGFVFQEKISYLFVYNSLFIVAALIFVPQLTFMLTLYLIYLSLRTKQKMTVVSLEISQCIQTCTI